MWSECYKIKLWLCNLELKESFLHLSSYALFSSASVSYKQIQIKSKKFWKRTRITTIIGLMLPDMLMHIWLVINLTSTGKIHHNAFMVLFISSIFNYRIPQPALAKQRLLENTRQLFRLSRIRLVTLR